MKAIMFRFAIPPTAGMVLLSNGLSVLEAALWLIPIVAICSGIADWIGRGD